MLLKFSGFTKIFIKEFFWNLYHGPDIEKASKVLVRKGSVEVLYGFGRDEMARHQKPSRRNSPE